MCNSYVKYFHEVSMWIPNVKPTSFEFLKYKRNPYKFYGIPNKFQIIRLFTIEWLWLFKLSPFLWNLFAASIFAINVSIKLLMNRGESIVITRDWVVLRAILLFKKIKIINPEIYFEAHKFSRLLQNHYKLCNGVITVNRHLADKLKNNNVTNIICESGAVNPEEYEKVEKYKFTKKKSYKVTYIGNLFEWKGVYTLADSLKYVKTTIELVVVGGSEHEFQEYKNYINKCRIENVTLVGHVKKIDLGKYLREADVFILPNSAKDTESFYYTSPIKLFEYMYSKRPIIASKIPSICEILIDKHNALLFESDNPRDLANKIDRVLSDEYEAMVENAFNYVKGKTWDNRGKKIYNFINK
jgi:glycosyltransferase involved in cell wall biosynthesis